MRSGAEQAVLKILAKSVVDGERDDEGGDSGGDSGDGDAGDDPMTAWRRLARKYRDATKSSNLIGAIRRQPNGIIDGEWRAGLWPVRTGGDESVSQVIFRPAGAWQCSTFYPRLAPWAVFCRRFAASRRDLAAIARRQVGCDTVSWTSGLPSG